MLVCLQNILLLILSYYCPIDRVRGCSMFMDEKTVTDIVSFYVRRIGKPNMQRSVRIGSVRGDILF